MLVVSIPFFISPHFNFIRLHYLQQTLHHLFPIQFPSYHLPSIRPILTLLQQNILSIPHPYLQPRLHSIIPVLNVLYSRSLVSSPPYLNLSLIIFIQSLNHIICLIVLLLMDGSISLLKMLIVPRMFVLFVPLKCLHCMVYSL